MPLNARYTESVSFTVPANTAVGQYKLIVIMDANNIFAETNEVNNTTVYNYKISQTETDYAPDACTFSSSTVKSGDVIMVNTKIANLGNTTTGQISYRLYWSTDNIFDASDLSRSTNVLVSTIAPRSVSGVSANTIAIPTVSNGTYYVICVTDPIAAIVELNENNNVKAFPITVQNVITSVETEFEVNELTLFPNPVVESLGISSTNDFETYTIYHTTGKMVATGKIENNTISVEHLTSGVYHLKLHGSNKSVVKEFIKQ
jgi:subtilase family serine protease